MCLRNGVCALGKVHAWNGARSVYWRGQKRHDGRSALLFHSVYIDNFLFLVGVGVAASPWGLVAGSLGRHILVGRVEKKVFQVGSDVLGVVDVPVILLVAASPALVGSGGRVAKVWLVSVW